MFDQAIEILKKGGVVILPTDTIYGIVGSALNQDTVERIYKLRKRSPEKPMIILIPSIEDLKKFGISLNEKAESFLKNNWPNPLSVILNCTGDDFEYLHRGTKTLAFRIPKSEKLINLLFKTGPLVAPSANFEGEKPAENISEAKKYFGDHANLYIDNGTLYSPPSTLIKIEDDKVKVIRQGAYKISK